jgi:AAA domain
MPNSFISRTAQRQKAKIRVGLSGPSGSGKTYSALKLAKGLAGEWDKVVVIDTEQGSGELYSDLGNYKVIPFNEPYSPERYIEAIIYAETLGADVIIIDSVTHEWEGKGGALQINEMLAQTQFRGNTWAAWSKTTPRHQAFIDKIVTSKCHIITTARAKTDTIQAEGKVKKVGVKEIQREGYEYELTLNFTLDREAHLAITSKDRTGIFIDQDPFLIDEKTGKTIKKWAESGIEPIAPPPAPVAPPVQQPQAPAQNQAQRPAPTTTARPAARPPMKTAARPAQKAPTSPAPKAQAAAAVKEKPFSAKDEAEALFGAAPGNTPDPNVIHDEEVDGYLQLIENLASTAEALQLHKELSAKTDTENKEKLIAEVISKGTALRAENK